MNWVSETEWDSYNHHDYTNPTHLIIMKLSHTESESETGSIGLVLPTGGAGSEWLTDSESLSRWVSQWLTDRDSSNLEVQVLK